MSESARMGGLLLCLVIVIFVLYQAFDASMTETLDEPTIRGIYKQGDAMNKDPKKMKDYMEKRLADSYVNIGSVINAAKDKPDQTIPVNQTKAQTIDNVVKGMDVKTIDKYEHKIIDVKFTDDKKYAYVSSTETTSGKLNFVLPGDKKISLPFNGASSCIDTLSVINKAIYFLRSDCTNKIAILQ